MINSLWTILALLLVDLLVLDAFIQPFHQEKAIKIGGVRENTSLSMSLTLYGSQGSRSPLVNWAAYELDLEIKMADNLGENPHPFKQIPCLVDDNDVVVFESGAILVYLLNKASSKKLSESQKASILSWISWANASLDPICFLETPDGKVYDTGLKKPNRRIDTLDSLLGEQDYLVPGEFTIADVAVAAYLLYVPQFFPGVDLSRWPNIVRYMKDCASRDAYKDAFGERVQGILIESLNNMNGGDEKEEKKKLFGMF